MEQKKIEQIQGRLSEQGVDGWLLYDNHGSNRFARQLLGISPHLVITRRFFYWIPKEGEPTKILHRIESESLEMLPGERRLYLSWTELEGVLKKVLGKAKQIVMEYSPRNANPNISVVDAGTLEVIKSMGIEVSSSADLLQHYTSILDEKQIASHLEAASVLETTFSRAWDLIADSLREEKRITEYDVQKFILSEFTAQNCITEDGPTCSVNGNSALPHYMASKHTAREIHRGDFLLIDMWCKKDIPQSIYADLTRVAVAAPQPTPRQEEIFKIVKGALTKGVDYIRAHVQKGEEVQGAQVDDICRGYIKKAGFGEYFTHRTGHNIDTGVHGAGANFDNLETADYRKILPGMCFSIEPGIYLPEEFGIRIEYNLLIGKDRSVEITGGTEENIVCLL
ncbi:MAG: M24 family metallopeptidase [Chlamydiales bacterium]|nr:M24 family metallopeptidase [Chlamydiales bacterium]